MNLANSKYYISINYYFITDGDMHNFCQPEKINITCPLDTVVTGNFFFSNDPIVNSDDMCYYNNTDCLYPAKPDGLKNCLWKENSFAVPTS